MKPLPIYRAGKHFTHFDHYTLTSRHHHLSSREAATEVVRAWAGGKLLRPGNRAFELKPNLLPEFPLCVALSYEEGDDFAPSTSAWPTGPRSRKNLPSPIEVDSQFL